MNIGIERIVGFLSAIITIAYVSVMMIRIKKDKTKFFWYIVTCVTGVVLLAGSMMLIFLK